MELELTNAVGWANLGFALEQTGDLANARYAYETTLRLEPNQPKVWNEVAVLHLRAGSGRGRRGRRAKRSILSPDYGVAYVNLGLALEKQGKISDAASALGRAITLLPNNARLQQELARLRQMQAPQSAPSPP